MCRFEVLRRLTHRRFIKYLISQGISTQEKPLLRAIVNPVILGAVGYEDISTALQQNQQLSQDQDTKLKILHSVIIQAFADEDPLNVTIDQLTESLRNNRILTRDELREAIKNFFIQDYFFIVFANQLSKLSTINFSMKYYMRHYYFVSRQTSPENITQEEYDHERLLRMYNFERLSTVNNRLNCGVPVHSGNLLDPFSSEIFSQLQQYSENKFERMIKTVIGEQENNNNFDDIRKILPNQKTCEYIIHRLKYAFLYDDIYSITALLPCLYVYKNYYLIIRKLLKKKQLPDYSYDNYMSYKLVDFINNNQSVPSNNNIELERNPDGIYDQIEEVFDTLTANIVDSDENELNKLTKVFQESCELESRFMEYLLPGQTQEGR